MSKVVDRSSSTRPGAKNGKAEDKDAPRDEGQSRRKLPAKTPKPQDIHFLPKKTPKSGDKLGQSPSKLRDNYRKSHLILGLMLTKKRVERKNPKCEKPSETTTTSGTKAKCVQRALGVGSEEKRGPGRNQRR